MRRAHSRAISSLVLPAFVLGASSWTARVRGDDLQACLGSSTEGQKLALQGKLREARAQFVVCTAAKCPAEVAEDCRERLAKVVSSLGSIVVSVRDADGKEVGDAKVLVDGEVAAEKIDGKAIVVDPGKHKVRVERAGEPAVEREIDVKEGAKDVPVSMTLGSTSSSRSTPTAAIVLASIGAAGVACFAGFGIAALLQSSDLHGRDSSTYTADDVDSLKTKRLVADLSLGVGVVTLGLAALVYFSRPADAKKTETALDLRTVPGGARLTWSVAF